MTETQVNFDYSIGTEDRFALRKWFDAFVLAQNAEEEKLENFFSVGLIVEGFTDEAMSKETFLGFMKHQKEQGTIDSVKYVEMKAKYKDASFMFTGSLEALSENILSYEGSVEIEVVKNEDGFQVDYFKFYPRLKVSH